MGNHESRPDCGRRVWLGSSVPTKAYVVSQAGQPPPSGEA